MAEEDQSISFSGEEKDIITRICMPRDLDWNVHIFVEAVVKITKLKASTIYYVPVLNLVEDLWKILVQLSFEV